MSVAASIRYMRYPIFPGPLVLIPAQSQRHFSVCVARNRESNPTAFEGPHIPRWEDYPALPRKLFATPSDRRGWWMVFDKNAPIIVNGPKMGRHECSFLFKHPEMGAYSITREAGKGSVAADQAGTALLCQLHSVGILKSMAEQREMEIKEMARQMLLIRRKKIKLDDKALWEQAKSAVENSAMAKGRAVHKEEHESVRFSTTEPPQLIAHSDLLRIMSTVTDQATQSFGGATNEPADNPIHQRPWYRSNAQKSPHVLSKRNQMLKEQYNMIQSNPNLAELRDFKSSLPLYQHRVEVCNLIKGAPFSIVVGATGSGKTTQVPQIILEDAILRGEGASVNIICTQPRRLAAFSVAKRVAVERHEKFTETVGYHVKNMVQLPKNPGSITYCTTGILLMQLQHHGGAVLDTISHIVIDEVHERDIDIDLLMVILKNAAERRQKARRPMPKIILMSATLDVGLFSHYFGHTDRRGLYQPCPSVSIPGRMFPVKHHYLKDLILQLAEYPQQEREFFLQDRKTQRYLEHEGAPHAEPRRSTSREAPIDHQPTYHLKASDTNPRSAIDDKIVGALVPIGLVVAAIAHIARTTSEGAILVFLPGIADINQVEALLMNSPLNVKFSDPAKYQITSLHSTLEGAQEKVFHSIPTGCRKIILTTNIAETSITIPELKFVVDTGKARESQFDQVTGITGLHTGWISKSNSRQRAGRAGRVQNGNYYALFSLSRYESMRGAVLPQILHSDLQRTCLAIKCHDFDISIRKVFAGAIEPPPPVAVDAAIKELQELDALTDDENLTPLGRLLASLPILPSTGKMIILGIIFRCFDPMLLLAVAAKEKTLFHYPDGHLFQADKAKRRFAFDTNSDQAALINSFRYIRSIQGRQDFLQQIRGHYLRFDVFRAVTLSMDEIEGRLVEYGLIPKILPEERFQGQRGDRRLNINSNNFGLVKALTLAGYRKNLALREAETSSLKTMAGKAVFSRSSVNVKKCFDSKVYSYNKLERNVNNQLSIHEATQISPLAATLFAHEIFPCQIRGTHGLVINNWLPLGIKSDKENSKAVDTIMRFRQALDSILSNIFSSLSKAKDVENYKCLADNPDREAFASALASILEMQEGASLEGGGLEVPDVSENIKMDFEEKKNLM